MGEVNCEHTTGSCAHTCVPWSGIMVNRKMPSSRRSQQTFPREEREAVNSVCGRLMLVSLRLSCVGVF